MDDLSSTSTARPRARNRSPSSRPWKTSTRDSTQACTRGIYALSAEESTRRFEEVREKVCRLLKTSEPREVVFTRGTTESINLVAQSWGRSHLTTGDEILITALEHHSNIVPWQLLCEQTGAVLRVAPIDSRGVVDRNAFEALLGDRTPTRGHGARIQRARHRRTGRRTVRAGSHPGERLAWSTAPRPCPICPWMFPRSAAISTLFRATNSLGPRVRVFSGADSNSWTRCPPTKAVAR